MPHDPPSPPPGKPGRPAKPPLVGGLPWQSEPPPGAEPAARRSTPAVPEAADVPEAAPAADVNAFDFGTQRGRGKAQRRPAAGKATTKRRSKVGKWIVSTLGDDEAAEFLGSGARLRARIEAWFQRSPPFTVSLCLHVVVLLVLALIIVRADRKRQRPIDLSFASETKVEAEEPGVQMQEPEPEPEPEAEPEAIAEDKPVVEDPIAAPVMAEAEKVEAMGSSPAAAAAPAIGSLLNGREAGQRARLVGAFGGSDSTEAAVERALAWLARQQGKDGLWSLQGPYEDGALQENRLAATAMALLAFQGAGNTPQAGKHKKVVATAWAALLKKQVPGNDGESLDERRRSGGGRFEISLHDPPARQPLYSHAQVTIALCELYGMTKDTSYEQPARRAVAYAAAAQGENGGWRYEPGQGGDMSVTGWFMMALKSAQMAGLEVPPETFAGLERFLDAVAIDDGARYGYRFEEHTRPVDAGDEKLVRSTAGPVTAAVSAEGLLCRQYLGWPREHPAFTAGMDILFADKFLDWEADKDVYAWYYITQVAHHLGGPAWERWNGRMKKVLPQAQVTKGREQGSWDPELDKWGPFGGRLFTTCFCTYMLEVYYRHLPLYGEDAVTAPATTASSP